MLIESLMMQARANTTHWLDSARPPKCLPLEILPVRVETAIVGAGIAGISVACELVKRGGDPAGLLLIDGAAPGHGASGRNGGFVLTYPGTIMNDWLEKYGEHFVAQLMEKNRRNRELVRDTVERFAVPCQRGGSYYIAGHADEEDWLRASAEFLGRDPESDATLVPPPPHSPHQRQALFVRNDFGVHSGEYLNRRLDECEAPYVTDCAITGCKAEGTGVVVMTTRGLVHAERVIFAANVHLPLLNEFFARTIPITPRRNQVMMLRPANAADRTWGDAIYYANEGYEYWRQFPDGRILLGGLRNRDAEGEARIELGANNHILEIMRNEFVPKLTLGAPFEIERVWSGVMGFTPDEIPVCGILPETDGRIAYLGGFSGYGVGLHRVVVEALVDSLGENDPDPIFSPDRIRQI